MHKLTMRQSDLSAQNLVATGRGQGQFEICNGIGHLSDFDREYVALSGYVGPHNPWTFAAAPELLEASIKAEALLTHIAGSQYVEPGALRALRDAIDKARGLFVTTSAAKGRAE